MPKEIDGVTYLTQDEVNGIVQERVARVKKESPPDYEDLKAQDATLAKLYPGMTAKQRAELIEQQIQQREAALRAQARGTTVDEELENQRRDREIAELKAKQQAKDKEEAERQAAAEAERKSKEAFDRQVAEFKEAYPDVDLKALNENPRFIKFLKGKALGESITLVEAYEDFVEITGDAEAKGFLDAKRKESRSTGGSDGSSGNTYGLTAHQIALAKENGIPLAKYAEHMKKIR
jgi:membrane protein involved in colicin uptake